MGVSEWVKIMAERLELMTDCAELNMTKGKENMSKLINRGSKLRKFVVRAKIM